MACFAEADGRRDDLADMARNARGGVRTGVVVGGLVLGGLWGAGCVVAPPRSVVVIEPPGSRVERPVAGAVSGSPGLPAGGVSAEGADVVRAASPGRGVVTRSGVSVLGELSAVPPPAVRGSPLLTFQQHTFVAEGADGDVAIDPSGQWMVFTSTRHEGRPKVYLQKTDGLTVTQLTADDSDDAHPTFSPDGRRIAFASNRTGRWAIYLMDMDGRNVVQVTPSRTHDLHPSFSPCGRFLAYCSLGPRTQQWELWVVELATGARRMIGEGLFPSWSPDASVNRIAFQRPKRLGSRLFSIWTVDLVDGEPRRLTEVASSPNSALVTPAWTPDGQTLVFTSITEQDGSAQYDLWSVRADGSERRRLTDGVGMVLSPAVASTGRVFFISDRSGLESVWSLPGAGSPAVAGGGEQVPSASRFVTPERTASGVPAGAGSAEAGGKVAGETP